MSDKQPYALKAHYLPMDDEELNVAAMRACGMLFSDVLHMDRRQRIAYGRAIESATVHRMVQAGYRLTPAPQESQLGAAMKEKP